MDRGRWSRLRSAAAGQGCLAEGRSGDHCRAAGYGGQQGERRGTRLDSAHLRHVHDLFVSATQFETRTAAPSLDALGNMPDACVQVTPEATFADDLKADSLDTVRGAVLHCSCCSC